MDQVSEAGVLVVLGQGLISGVDAACRGERFGTLRALDGGGHGGASEAKAAVAVHLRGPLAVASREDSRLQDRRIGPAWHARITFIFL